ncbi:hypothetical protein JCM10449v2_005820 [Rhodotorula kratochvilovae]
MSLSRASFLRLPAPHASLSPSPPPESPSPSLSPARRGRLRPGTRAQDAFPSDPFSPPRPFAEFDDSPFAVQEFVAELVRRDAGDVEVVVKVPTEDDGEEGEEEGDGRELVDEDVWLYEQLKRITLDQHAWIAALSDECTPTSCPSMTTSPSWLFVCAAHAHPPSPPCTALSYLQHTSDGAQALLTSPRYFPSRLSVSAQGRRLLGAVARRLWRGFAHAYFHHHALFVHLESETSLVARFAALNRRFALVEDEGLGIPAFELGEDAEREEDAEGEEEGGIRAVEREERNGCP